MASRPDAQKHSDNTLNTIDMTYSRRQALLDQIALLKAKLLELRQPLQRPLPNHWHAVTQSYLNYDPATYRITGYHVGTDFAAPKGTPILAPADGYITRSGYTDQLGYWSEFHFRGQYMISLHLRSKPACVWVRKGTPVGYVGSTGKIRGIHAHLELWTIPMNRALLTTREEVVKYTRDITKIIP